jgi:hypothetical protein
MTEQPKSFDWSPERAAVEQIIAGATLAADAEALAFSPDALEDAEREAAHRWARAMNRRDRRERWANARACALRETCG